MPLIFDDNCELGLVAALLVSRVHGVTEDLGTVLRRPLRKLAQDNLGPLDYASDELRRAGGAGEARGLPGP